MLAESGSLLLLAEWVVVSEREIANAVIDTVTHSGMQVEGTPRAICGCCPAGELDGQAGMMCLSSASLFCSTVVLC